MLKNILRPNCYYDSVTLMVISSTLKNIKGVNNASVMMGTESNLGVLNNAGLLLPENNTPDPNLMLICIDSNVDISEEVVNVIDTKLNEKVVTNGVIRAKTINNAIERLDNPNFAVVSIPGVHAKKEVEKLLKNNIHVMLFSDNVTMDEELELKQIAVDKGLLMMGPDCGTSIINGVPMGFANMVNRGNIGLIAASGTGLQEVSATISNLGGGISQALGTGGRDLKDKIGGLMTFQALEALKNDPDTNIIVIISKPTSKVIYDHVINKLKETDKKSVVCILGAGETQVIDDKIHVVATLYEAGVEAAKLSGVDVETTSTVEEHQVETAIEKLKKNKSSNYVRALYSGGTLCYEAILNVDGVYSNIAVNKELALPNVEESIKDTFIDMGEDYFTSGKPHPMIDQSVRLERLEKEVKDPDVGIILFDVVLGYGSNYKTAEELKSKIIDLQNKYLIDNRYVLFVATVCGTELDPQVKSKQIKILQEAEVLVYDSNIKAVETINRVLKSL